MKVASRRKTPIPPNSRLTWSMTEAAAALGISRDAAYDAAARNELPTIRIGSRRLVPRAALERLLQIDDE